uniref:Putative serine proteinase inhibitor n=1 Tax=Hyalomma excavatum TaxID=257692 RepID=A0A131XN02_9ACAR
MTTEVSNTVQAFSIDLYKQLLVNDTGNTKNVVASPFSIATILSMTLAGARGATAEEVAGVLHIQSAKDAHIQLSKVLTQLSSCPQEAIVVIANRLYCEKTFSILEEYTNLLKEFYHSAIVPANFKTDTEEARLAINAWVEEATKSKIKDLVPRGTVDTDTTLVLINAVYFSGTWKDQFPKYATSPGDFHVSKVKVKTVDMMCNEARYQVCTRCDGLNASAIELPYKGGKASMLILLPDEVDGLADLEASLTATKLAAIVAALQGPTTFTKLSLPRFKVEQATDLKTMLRNMGIKDLFSSGADLSGISGKKELAVSAAIHKAFVEVTEQGTEAAAATAIAAANYYARSVTNFTVDRPFMFLIKWHDPCVVLFMGSVRDI